MNKQQKILFITMACLGGSGALFVALSKVESALLMVGLALLSAFFGLLTFMSISKLRKQEREQRNREIEELMNAEDDEDEDNVAIEVQKRKMPNYSKYSYVMLCLIATCVSVYMFIRSIISF